jgi:multiple sugar transport system ATP-binding protein
MSALTISNLEKTFGSFAALKDINLDIDDGEFVVLVGPSGCGKSTLLNIIAGLEKHSVGDVKIGGKVVNSRPARDRDIAMVFQSYALYPSMTVRENIEFGMKCRGVPAAERAVGLHRVSELLQIGSLLERKPSQLSGGQRQRVAIGRALVRDPVLFLFDEPLSNLDAKLRVQMRLEIKQLHQRIGKTTVYVTHDQIEAMTLASRVAVMFNGEVQQFDRPDVVYNAPANLFVARFMGSPPMNTVSAEIARSDRGFEVIVGKGKPDEFRLSLGSGHGDLNAWLGKTVILGLRPEHISQVEPEASSPKQGSQTLTAQVTMTEPTGAETIVLISAGGESFFSRNSPDCQLATGDRAEFLFDTRKLCLFDPDTEKRLS